ncbi:MAG: chromophore lyase CpcT/CpeT [Elainellaceae cyanobacterium]
MPQSLITLAHWLAGEFDNQPQALDNPIWFVHLRLWHRPLPFQINGNLALLAEQANILYLDRPYRQRVVVLQPTAMPDQWRAQYFAFKQPDRVRGAGANPDLLKSLSLDDLELLPGCVLTVTEQATSFKAEPEPGAKCYFQYEEQTRQVVLGFEVSADRFLSYDRGVEVETGKSLWGAIMGAYEFQKRQDFSAEFP